MTVFVGNDWAGDHHDVHVMNDAGAKLAARRLPEGLAGIEAFHQLIAPHITGPGEVVVGIETDQGMWVAALVAAGYHVYAINPLAVARYRDRHAVSGAKSDAGDAKVLADLVRTDRHNHRPIAGDTTDVEAIRIVARGHQSLIWTRSAQTNMLRSSLMQYYPAATKISDELGDRDTLAVLAKAPTPAEGARLTIGQITAALR
jgi:transposase